MQEGAATHVSHVTQEYEELLEFFFFFFFLIFHYCSEWYAGGRLYTCVPCHTRIRRAVGSFLILFIYYIYLCLGMQEGATVNVSHVTH